MCFKPTSNLFDDLFFSKATPLFLAISVFAYAIIVVIPVVVRCSLLAKYFIYIGGLCEVPCNYFTGLVFPWIVGIVINHLQIFLYLINWTSLVTCVYVSFVCPMFMWSKSLKEANIYENNFHQSLEMIMEGDKQEKSFFKKK